MKSRQTDQSPKTFAEVLYLLVLIGLTTMLGYSQAAGSDYVELSPKLRQTVKTHFSLNGELSHGNISTEVHEGI